jgi:chaperonin cofactor prefoldin
MSLNSKIKINLDSLKSRREWKRHKVKDGHNVFRILPPFGESSNGYPYRKWQIIWGLADPETGRMRPFASSMTSEKRCPVTEYVQALTTKAEELKASLQATGTSKEEVTARLKDISQLINDLKPKTVYLYNAVDKSGEVGLLELKSTAHKKMKTEMGQYVGDYNQDPTSLNSNEDDSGVWFDVIRTGIGRDTEYDVKKCQVKTKSLNGKIQFEDDRSPLPESIVQNYSNLAYDLSTVYQVKTYDELQEILEANLRSIHERVPDADIGASSQEERPVTTSTSTRSPQKTTKAVTTRFDDNDDEEDDLMIGAVTTNKMASTTLSLDDDFMAEADAILNS